MSDRLGLGGCSCGSVSTRWGLCRAQSTARFWFFRLHPQCHLELTWHTHRTLPSCCCPLHAFDLAVPPSRTVPSPTQVPFSSALAFQWSLIRSPPPGSPPPAPPRIALVLPARTSPALSLLLAPPGWPWCSVSWRPAGAEALGTHVPGRPWVARSRSG